MLDAYLLLQYNNLINILEYLASCRGLYKEKEIELMIQTIDDLKKLKKSIT